MGAFVRRRPDPRRTASRLTGTRCETAVFAVASSTRHVRCREEFHRARAAQSAKRVLNRGYEVSRDRAKPRNAGLSMAQMSRGFAVCVSCYYDSSFLSSHHCIACDRKVCSLCVVQIVGSGEYFCPECAAEEPGVPG
jgi:hypothetical protein